MSEQDPIVITEVAGRLQAEILRGLLEAQGIPAALSQESAATVYGLTTPALGSVQVLVPASYRQQAEQILEAYQSGQFENEALDLPDEPEA
jgi:hypothetical protein